MWTGWEHLTPALRFANFHDARPGEGFGPRYISDFQLLFIQAGAGSARIGAQRLKLGAGDLLFYGPNVMHHVVADKGVVLRLIGVHFLFCTDDASRIAQALYTAAEPYRFADNPPRCPLAPLPPPLLSPGSHSAIRRTLELVVASFLAAPQARPLEKRGLLLLLLEQWHDALLQQVGAGALPQAHRRILQAAEESLRQQLATPPNVGTLSQAAGLSADHFRRLFKQHTGFSVQGFVQEQRLLRARELLIAGELNVNEVARAVGLSDPYYFSRLFSRRFGIAPSRFRKQPWASEPFLSR